MAIDDDYFVAIDGSNHGDGYFVHGTTVSSNQGLLLSSTVSNSGREVAWREAVVSQEKSLL